jgi:hypothetical protein
MKNWTLSKRRMSIGMQNLPFSQRASVTTSAKKKTRCCPRPRNCLSISRRWDSVWSPARRNW